MSADPINSACPAAATFPWPVCWCCCCYRRLQRRYRLVIGSTCCRCIGTEPVACMDGPHGPQSLEAPEKQHVPSISLRCLQAFLPIALSSCSVRRGSDSDFLNQSFLNRWPRHLTEYQHAKLEPHPCPIILSLGSAWSGIVPADEPLPSPGLPD